jgi:hypothetical protein
VAVLSRVHSTVDGKPAKVVLESRFEDTEEARAFASEHGWESARPGAWAKAMQLSMPLRDAQKALASVLRMDPAIVGLTGRRG